MADVVKPSAAGRTTKCLSWWEEWWRKQLPLHVVIKVSRGNCDSRLSSVGHAGRQMADTRAVSGGRRIPPVLICWHLRHTTRRETRHRAGFFVCSFLCVQKLKLKLINPVNEILITPKKKWFVNKLISRITCKMKTFSGSGSSNVNLVGFF